MFNHVRTYLLNADYSATADGPGEELIPAGFRAVRAPSAVAAVRSVLFGSNPDRRMLNFRAAQLMALLHAGPLEQYVLAPDPRVTYDPFDAGLAADVPPDVSPPSEPGSEIRLSGTPASPDATGRTLLTYDVLVGNGEVSVSTVRPAIQKLVSSFEPGDDGLSGPHRLGGSGLSFRSTTGSWRVSLALRPTRDLGDLAAAVAGLGEPTLVGLFGVGDAEPYRTFRNLWYDCAELPARLGALALALSYRTAERGA